jgi:glucosamine-6-phosphate deaminase
MKINWCEDRAAMGALAADRVCDLLGARPDAVLALPTGHTPLGLYAELVRRCDAGQVQLDHARYFNLDDYRGLAEDHPLSYARFLRRHLFVPARIAETQIRLLQGNAADVDAECRDYDARIAQAGGLDLAILGLGVNGHIAFNEPGASWNSRTHVVTLDAQTRATHREQAGDAHMIPLQAITMGVATILEARRILLLVSGTSKRPALDALLRGTQDPRWPVTSLLGHPQLQVMADSALRPQPA